MAMIRCPDCGAEVSGKAAACLKCGRPIKFKSSAARLIVTTLILVVLGGAFLSMVAAVLSGCGAAPDVSPPTYEAQSGPCTIGLVAVDGTGMSYAEMTSMACPVYGPGPSGSSCFDPRAGTSPDAGGDSGLYWCCAGPGMTRDDAFSVCEPHDNIWSDGYTDASPD
jgi:uncharacterized OB-fold protein